MNAMQLERFRAVASAVPARRYSIANSAGICLGRDYSFDLVRPGLSLYGGFSGARPREIRQVARVEAQVVQRRTIPAGETCGYGATFVARAGYRGRDPQHRLCRRISARLLVTRVRVRGSCAAGARPGVDGPDRGRLRRRAAAQGRRLGRARLRSADRVEAVRAFAVRAFDDARLAVRAALGLARSSGGGVFGL